MLLTRRRSFRQWHRQRSCFCSRPGPGGSQSGVFKIVDCLSISAAYCALPGRPETYTSNGNPNDFNSAVRYLKNKLRPERLIAALDAIADPGSAVGVFRWASRQNNFLHNSKTYARIIFRLGSVGDLHEMEELLLEMVEEKRPSEEEALASLVAEFSRNGRIMAALKVFEVAARVGDRRLPPVWACNALLGALAAERGNFEHVVFVYKEMVKGGVLPDGETVNHLIEVLLETGRVDSAVAQYRRMGKKGCVPNARTFEVLLTGLFALGRVDDSIGILGEMFQMKCLPSSGFYHSIIPLLCRFGWLEEGIRLLRTMRDSGSKPDSLLFETLIHCLCENAQVDNAVEIFYEMQELEVAPTVDTYVDMVSAYCKVGSFSMAFDFLDKIQNLNAEPYNALLKAYSDDRRFRGASTLFKKMLELEIIDDHSWNILINGFCQSGDICKAFEVLARRIVSSGVANIGTYSAIITCQCKMDQYDSAMRFLQQVYAQNWSLDPISYDKLVSGLCYLKRFKEAAKLFVYMSERGGILSISSLNLLIQGFCSMGKVNEAITIWSLASHSGVSLIPDIVSTIILHSLELNKLGHVLVLFSRMLVEGCSMDTRTYCLVIRGFCAQSMTKETTFMFNQMISDGFLPDPITLDMLISCMSKHSKLHLLTDGLLIVLEHGVLCSTTYDTIISSFLKEGHNQEAHRFLEIMLEKGWIPCAESHALLIGYDKKEARDKVVGKVDNDKVVGILAQGLQKGN